MSLSHVSRHPYCGVSCPCSSCSSLTQVGWLSITLSWPSDSLLRYMYSQYTALAASNSPRATNLNSCLSLATLVLLLSPSSSVHPLRLGGGAVHPSLPQRSRCGLPQVRPVPLLLPARAGPARVLGAGAGEEGRVCGEMEGGRSGYGGTGRHWRLIRTRYGEKSLARSNLVILT